MYNLYIHFLTRVCKKSVTSHLFCLLLLELLFVVLLFDCCCSCLSVFHFHCAFPPSTSCTSSSPSSTNALLLLLCQWSTRLLHCVFNVTIAPNDCNKLEYREIETARQWYTRNANKRKTKQKQKHTRRNKNIKKNKWVTMSRASQK